MRALFSGALLLCIAIVAGEPSFGQELAAPEAVAAPDVPLVAKPSQGPQALDLAGAPTAVSTGSESTNAADARAVTETKGAVTTTTAAVTTTSATTSASSGPPDKAFAAKVNAPHNGSFTYSIDIKEPDFRGLEPDFRLNYDSSQGIANNAAHQNWLGLGWSLSGFSVIERASPGRGTPFYSDTLDTYVLDGLEMVACTTSMVSPGCSAGGTHAMRAENYQRIVRNTSANSWTVTGRDGTQYLYKPVSNWQSYNGSSTTESKLATQYRWLLATITDRHGNQVGYSYWCDGVQHCYPDEVSYNGTAIKFYREARPAEDQFDYATGVNLARVNYRIKSIAVRTGGSLVRAYALSHEQSASTFMSRLKSVKEFGNDAMVDAAGVVSGGTSLPATQMSYSEQTRGFDVVDTGVTDSGPSSSDWNSTGTSENASQSVRLVADFNGDGRTDLGYGSSSYSYSRIDTTNDSFHNYECSTGLALYLSTGAGLSPASSTGVSGANTESGCSDYPSLGTTLGDFDGDGATNVIVNDKFFTIHPSTGILSSASYAIPGGAIGDFNGDGKADFLTRSSSSRFIYLSTGTSFTKSASVTFGSSSQKTKIGDFNGDGRDDIVDGIYSKSGSETRTLRLSTGTAVVNQPSIRTSLASDTGSGEVADVNGDGRADINMSIGDDYVHHLRSNGSALESVTLNNNGNENWRTSAWDLNGDGRADGHGTWNSTATPFQIKHAQDVTAQSWGLGGTGVAGSEEEELHNGSGDFNGDGLADFMLRASWGGWNGKIALSKGPVPDFLMSVKNPEGGTISVTYKPSSYWNSTSTPSLYNPHTRLPFIIQTVETITTDDGLGLSTSKAKTTYSYSGGKWSFAERQFLGFSKIDVFHPCNAGETACPTTEMTYRQDYAAAGEPERIDYRDGSGTLLRSLSNSWTVNNTTLPYRALLDQSWLYEYSGASSKAAGVDRDYDIHGNVTRYYFFGDSALSGDERSIARDFYPNTSSYVVSCPARERLYDSSGALKVDTVHYYDGSTSSTTAPSRCDETRIERLDDSTGTYVSASATYDGYGNAITRIDEVGSPTSIAYDETYHLFPIETRLPLYASDARFVTRTAWNGGCQMPISETDINGRSRTTQYDALCRVIRMDEPYQGASTKFALKSYMDFGAPALQRIVTQTNPPHGSTANLWSESFFDGLGREYKTRASGADGKVIRKDKAFNARGAVLSETAPYFEGETVYTTSHTYDALDRVIKTAQPDGTAITTAYGISSFAFTKVGVTDEVGRLTTTHYDGFGRKAKEIVTALGTTVEVPIITLAYDVQDKVVSLSDALGNQWSYTYDALGRRISASDPDLGLWTYSYDAKGRLVSQTDAKGQVTTLAYDAMDRLIQKTVSASGVTEIITQVHDQERPGYYNVGELTSSAKSQGGIDVAAQSFDFDEAGKLALESWTIDGTSHRLSTSYDAGGRVVERLYPNKHTGIYQDATADPYEDVKFFQGQRVDLDHEIKFLFKTSLLRDLAKLGCLWTNINPPLVNGIIGELLSQHASSDVQLLRAHIFANDGETLDYYLVNIMSLVHCLDYEKSIIDSFWDDGRPRGISKLRFKSDACMNGHAIARLEEYHTTQLVSEDLYQALSKLKYKGLHFELDSDGDGYRF